MGLYMCVCLGQESAVPRLHLLVCDVLVLVAGAFNSFKSTYDFQLQPSILDDYLAILTIRHPNVSGSFVMTRFRLSVSPNPATAAAATVTNITTSTAAAPVVLFNPLVNPRLVCSVVMPSITLSTYSGGSTKLLADFNSIVASNAVLDSPAWVQSSLTNSTPVTINATVSLAQPVKKANSSVFNVSARSGCTATACCMHNRYSCQMRACLTASVGKHTFCCDAVVQAWFPSNYANITSSFQSLSALDYFIFLLNQLPTVAFSSAQLPAFIASGARVS